VRIGRHELTPDNPFVVAEVGLNHNGSLDRALEMVAVAAKCGVDAVKFGVFKAAEFCREDDPLYDHFKRCELPDHAWFALKEACEAQGVEFFGTPQNPSDLDLLLRVGVPCVKIGSDDLTNTSLVFDYAKRRLPMILSSGMADEAELLTAIAAVYTASGQAPVVLACTSEYPCPPGHANVRRVMTLHEQQLYVGYSDHTEGTTAAVLAVAYGAVYLEKHFTLDRTLTGPDHAWSADPAALNVWVRAIREASIARGTGAVRPTAEERKNRAKWRRKSGQQLRGDAWTT